jgi:hypothetical protein
MWQENGRNLVADMLLSAGFDHVVLSNLHYLKVLTGGFFLAYTITKYLERMRRRKPKYRSTGAVFWMICTVTIMFHVRKAEEALYTHGSLQRNQSLEDGCLTKCLTRFEGQLCELHFEWLWNGTNNFNSTEQNIRLGCRIKQTRACDAGGKNSTAFNSARERAINRGRYGGVVHGMPGCFYIEETYRIPFSHNETSDGPLCYIEDTNTTIMYDQ